MKQVNVPKPKAKAELHVDMPGGINDILVSYDGKFITYNENNLVNIINTTNGEKQSIENLNTEDLLKSIWLPDRNLMLFLQKESNKINLYNYDVEKKSKQKIITITNYLSSYKDFNIKSSAITGVIYVKVDSMIYRTDINQTKVIEVPIRIKDSTDIFIIPTKDRLVYEDVKNSIYLTQPKEKLNIKSDSQTKILGVDDESIIYLGELKDGKVISIISSDPKKERLKLTKETEIKDIFVNNKGEVFVNDSSKNVITELLSLKETKYEGSFLSFYNNGVASILDGKYYKIKFDK